MAQTRMIPGYQILANFDTAAAGNREARKGKGKPQTQNAMGPFKLNHYPVKMGHGSTLSHKAYDWQGPKTPVGGEPTPPGAYEGEVFPTIPREVLTAEHITYAAYTARS
ncbi:hypothetical protein I7I51_06107 [Histoplasma capsulatum]|uniref:Uncharacterized protein n=1 Tax=Ajellomyces capsulatus TaxID=5037 RepID=A0A8A1MHA8_AJECA|nr:hypothetical protein I7I51_06107 [Histoplasma capsulatum]